MPDTLAVPPYVTVEQARDAIRELVPDLAGEPAYADCSDSWPFGAYYKFSVPETGEDFIVNCYTGFVRTWEMGESHHALPPAEFDDDQEGYERQLIDAYYPVPAAEMVRDERYEHVWRRTLPSDVHNEAQTCSFHWSQDGEQVTRFYRTYWPIKVSTRPELTYAQGLQIARRSVADSLGIDADELSRKEDYLNCLLSVDSTGTQVLNYMYVLDIPRDRDWGEIAPWVGYYTVVMAVDARDGVVACVPPFGEKAGDVRKAMGLRDLAVSPDRDAYYTSYQPRMIGKTWYMCWLYLDSAGWPGKLSVREHRGRAIHDVRYHGRRYSLIPSEPKIQTAAGDIALSAPPVMLGEKLWVPLDAIEHITGWSVRPHHKYPWMMLTPPSLTD